MRKYRLSWLSIIGILIFVLGISSFCFSQTQPYKGMKVVAPMESLPSTTTLVDKLPEFEKRTGMKVELLFMPQAELWDRIVIDASTKAGAYQVYGIGCMFLPEFIQTGWILPLDKYIGPYAKEYEPEDIMMKYALLNTYDGVRYGLPIYGEVSLIWHRRDLLEDAGMAPPQTIDQFWEQAKYFTRPPDLYGVAMRGRRGSEMALWIWPIFLHSFGGDFLDENNFPVFNSKAGVKSAKYYRDILRKYGPPGAGTYTWDDTAVVYSSGKVAMIIESIDFLDRVVDPQKSEVAGKTINAPVPAGPFGTYPGIYTHTLTMSAAGNKSEKQQEATAEFLRWATSKEMENYKAFQAHVPTPTRRSIFMSPKFRAKYGEKNYPGWLASYVRDLELASPDFRPRIQEWRQFSEILGISLEEINTGQKPVEEALNEAATKVIKLFQKTGRIKQ